MATRVLIVDDEAPARRKLGRFVAELTDWQVVGDARSVATAVAAICEHRPDLLLLDIQLGDGTGFDVIEALPAKGRPRVVFVTAYDEHALRAFDVHAQDYLLKPVDRARFAACVRRVDEAGDGPDLDRRLRALLRELAPPSYLVRLYVEEGERGRFIPAQDIVRIEAARNYLDVHAHSGTHRVRGTLAALLAELDPSRFVQVNRSTLVNLDQVTEVQTWFRGDRLLLLADGSTSRLGRAYLARSDLLRGLLAGRGR